MVSIQNPNPAVLKARFILDDAADAEILAQTETGTGWDGTNIPGITIYPGEEDGDIPAQVDGPFEGTTGRRFHADQYYGDPWPVSPHFCQQLLADQRYGPGSYYPNYAEPFNPPCFGFINNYDTECAFSFWFKRHTKRSGTLVGFGDMYTNGYTTPLWGYSMPETVVYFGDSENLCWGVTGWSYVSSRAGGIETNNDYDDGLWHFVVVRFASDEESETNPPVQVDLFIDAELVSSWVPPDTEDWTGIYFGNQGFSPVHVGGGQLWRAGRDTYMPDTSIWTEISGCGCDIYDIRQYCGYLTDDEIDELYGSTPPTGANLLVFSGGLTVA